MKSGFLSEVAHRTFCVKFVSLMGRLRILEKSYQSPQIVNIQIYIWYLFRAKNKFIVRR